MNPLIAPDVVEHAIVIDQQIEIEVIEPQRHRIRVVDADREIEIHRRRNSEIHARLNTAKLIRRVEDVQICERVAAGQQNQDCCVHQCAFHVLRILQK